MNQLGALMLVNSHDAKTHFSKLISQALKGDEVIIARNGKPVIRLTPYAKEKQTRKGGQLLGLIKISKDFDAPLPDEMLSAFSGEQK